MVRYRRWIVALYLVVAAALAPGLLRLRIDDSAEGFFTRDAETLERLQRLELDYGRDRVVRLVLEGDDLWTRQGLSRLGAIEMAAGDRHRVGGGVYGSVGMVHHHRWHRKEWPPPDPAAFRDLVSADPVDRNGGWVGRDARTATVLVGLFRMPPEREAETLERLETLLPPPRPAVDPEGRPAASDPPGGSDLHGFMTGLPVVVQALDRALAEMAGRLFPGLLLVAVSLLLALFGGSRRSPGEALLPLAPLVLVTVTLTVLFGAMGYAGQRLDAVTVILVPLVFVIALATGIHVLAYHRRLRALLRTDRSGLDPGDTVQATYRVKAWPVLWTGLTTCAGFGSLAVAETPPVRMLGLWAAFGIAYLTLAALSFYPALLAMADAGGDPSPLARIEEGLARHGRRWARAAVARPRLVSGLFGAVGLLAVFGLPRLAVETDVLRYFPPEHPVRAGVAALEERGIGTVAASLVLDFPEKGAADRPAVLRRLAELAQELREEPLVLAALSFGDLAADVARHDPERPDGDSPRADDALTAALARMDRVPDLRRARSAIRAGGGERTRVILFTRFRGHRELEPVFRRAEATARRAFPQAEAHVTGLYPLVLAAQRSVLRTMVLSLTLTFLVIGAVFRWLLGSASLTFRALLANAWPVLLVLGAMGWLGVAVEGPTVMVGAVVLALAVDDTLHTLGHFRRRVGRGTEGWEPRDAVVETLAETAPGHASTSVVLSLGFATCALSSLVPVARFGALAVLGIAGALAADLLLVPALLAGASTPRSAGSGPRRRRPGAGGSGSSSRWA